MSRWWNNWRNKGHRTKKRVESYRSLDCSWCYDKRKYPFEEGEKAFFHGYCLELYSSHALAAFQNNGINLQYKIPVVATKCNYGGQRHWFICPFPFCHRRSKKLYLHSQGIFSCRKCLKLAYASQNRSKLDRIIDKKWALIHKLGGDSDFIAQKPKRMHRKTFHHIQEEIWRLNELGEQGIFEQFCSLFNLL
jgi:hypothetical protein